MAKFYEILGKILALGRLLKKNWHHFLLVTRYLEQTLKTMRELILEQYDYITKVYGTYNLWNLRPNVDSDNPTSVVSATRERIEMVTTTKRTGESVALIITGDFQWSGDFSLGTIFGTVDEFKALINEALILEEKFPKGTSVKAWMNGGYAFEMSLLNGNDLFVGSAFSHENGADYVRGGNGNDTFIGYGSPGGQDYFFGEGGIDTSVYQGRISEYVIEISDNIRDERQEPAVTVSGFVVKDLVAMRDDVDNLVGVERLRFSDVTLALDIDGVAAEAYRIYKAAFDRQPDLPGLGFWIKNMDAGVGLGAVAQEFINSAEFIRLYGANPSDEQFVDLLYANVLDRQADQSGYDFWIGALDRGLTRAGLLVEFSESRENIGNVAPLIENGIQYTAFVG